MRKVLLISGLALAVAGCAAQQGQAPQVQVRDLSASRERAPAAHYTVEAGDTLYGIAWRHGMDYRDLAQLNQISPPYQIRPGQQLTLTAGAQAPVRQEEPTSALPERGVAVATPLGGGQSAAAPESIDWLLPEGETAQPTQGLAVQPLDGSGPSQVAVQSATQVADGPGPVYDYDSPGAGAPEATAPAEAAAPSETAVEASREVAAATPEPTPEPQPEPAPEPAPAAQESPATVANGAAAAPDRSNRTYTPVDEVNWQWPTDGQIVGRFGEGATITAGIDIAGQKGQPVRAAGPGIVVYAGSGVRGYGNLILLKHNDQFLSAYAHNDTLRVRENDVVEAGEVIATMGDSDAEDVRLHFEVRKDGQPQNPLNFLPPR